MSTWWLKIIALLSMSADHMNKGFGLGDPILAVFGRLAFPLFCYLSSVGFRKTRSKTRYLLRLLVCALISEIPFDLLWHGKLLEFSAQNVCFTLFLGGMACTMYDHFAKHKSDLHRAAGILLALVFIAGASFLRTDYGLYGAGLLFVLYLFPQNALPQVASVCAFDFLLCGVQSQNVSEFFSYTQHFSLLSIPFIVTASEKKSRYHKNFILKYLFYLYYPAHMALIYAIKVIK